LVSFGFATAALAYFPVGRRLALFLPDRLGSFYYQFFFLLFYQTALNWYDSIFIIYRLILGAAWIFSAFFADAACVSSSRACCYFLQ